MCFHRIIILLSVQQKVLFVPGGKEGERNGKEMKVQYRYSSFNKPTGFPFPPPHRYVTMITSSLLEKLIKKHGQVHVIS